MNRIKTSNGVVADNLKEIISEQGLTHAEVAKKAGLTKQEMSDMLNGRRLIKASDIERLIDILHVDANRMFRRPEENER